MYFILRGTRNLCIETIWILTIIIFDHSNITATGTVWSQFFDARIQTRVNILNESYFFVYDVLQSHNYV